MICNDARGQQGVYSIDENEDGNDEDGSGAYDDDGDVYGTENYHLTGTEASFEELDMGEGQKEEEGEADEEALRIFGVQENESIWDMEIDEEMNMRIEQVGVIRKKRQCEVTQMGTYGTHMGQSNIKA